MWGPGNRQLLLTRVHKPVPVAQISWHSWACTSVTSSPPPIASLVSPSPPLIYLEYSLPRLHVMVPPPDKWYMSAAMLPVFTCPTQPSWIWDAYRVHSPPHHLALPPFMITLSTLLMDRHAAAHVAPLPSQTGLPSRCPHCRQCPKVGKVAPQPLCL